MILSVGDIQEVVVERETLRTIEARLREDAVAVALQPRPDRVDHPAVERGDDDAIVV